MTTTRREDLAWRRAALQGERARHRVQAAIEAKQRLDRRVPADKHSGPDVDASRERRYAYLARSHD